MKTIKGRVQNDDGTYGQFGPEYLVVEQTAKGFRDAETGSPISASEYAVTADITAIEITSEHGVWRFSPEPGECERIGLAVKKMESE